MTRIEQLEEEYNLHYMLCTAIYKEICAEYDKQADIDTSWKEQQQEDSNDWMNIPSTEEIFSRRTVDNGDRFHHYDKDGRKRRLRIGKFISNYSNALKESKRQDNLDRIAQWAVLDRVKQDIIDSFIDKYSLSKEEIARFEEVMIDTFNDIYLDQRNIYDDAWYASHNPRFDQGSFSLFI